MVDWNSIAKVEPNAVAIAIDAAGMLSVFTTAPIFMDAPKTWVPTGEGTKLSLGLSGIASSFEPAGTLQIRPGCEALVAEQKEAWMQGRVPKEVKPKEAAGFDSNMHTAEELLKAVGEVEKPAGFVTELEAVLKSPYKQAIDEPHIGVVEPRIGVDVPVETTSLEEQLTAVLKVAEMGLAKLDALESVVSGLAGRLKTVEEEVGFGD